MRASPFFSKLLLNLYPPLLVSRIIIKYVSKDFKTVKVKIRKSLLNRNLQGSIFGGTIFSAADPFIALMYWQILNREGIYCQAWLRSATINYLKPAKSSLFLLFEINDDELLEAKEKLRSSNKHQIAHSIEMKNAQGEVCASMETVVFLRMKHKKKAVD